MEIETLIEKLESCKQNADPEIALNTAYKEMLSYIGNQRVSEIVTDIKMGTLTNKEMSVI